MARGRRWEPGIIRARRSEGQFARQLRKVARHVEDLVALMQPTDADRMSKLDDALNRYSDALEPWARASVNVMHEQVNVRDLQSWSDLSKEMGRQLKREIETAPTGRVMRDLLEEQVGLITSLPRDAADRVHRLTLEGLTDGTRAAEIAAEIAKQGEVTKAQANCIARTEVSRTAATLTQARAEFVGSTQYIWHTSGDADVRPSHAKLNGTVQRWNAPPVCDQTKAQTYRAHPGCIFNCRCWAEPIIPDFETVV